MRKRACSSARPGSAAQTRAPTAQKRSLGESWPPPFPRRHQHRRRRRHRRCWKGQRAARSARRCRPSAAATSICSSRLLARAHPAHPLSGPWLPLGPLAAASACAGRRMQRRRLLPQRTGARGASARCARSSPRVQQRGRRHASRPDAAKHWRHAAERTGACSARARPAAAHGAPPARREKTRAQDSRREDAGEAGPSLMALSALATTFCRCKKLVHHDSPGSLSVSDYCINDRADVNVPLARSKFL